MKKSIVTLTVLLGLSGFGRAQDGLFTPTDLRGNLLFGIKGGLNASNVYDSEGENFQADPKAGLVAGAFLAIPIGTYLGFQPEILFSQKGYQSTGTMMGSFYMMTRTTNWIDVPLLFSFKPLPMLNIVGGPQYSYLLSRRDVFRDGNSTVEQEEEFKNENLRKNMLCVSGGIDLSLGPFVAGGRVGWDLQENHGDGTSSTPRYKNVWYQFTLGLRFAG